MPVPNDFVHAELCGSQMIRRWRRRCVILQYNPHLIVLAYAEKMNKEIVVGGTIHVKRYAVSSFCTE